MDKDTGAAARFFRAVQAFSEAARPWDTGVIWYETKPDEIYNLPLVSWRVYKRFDEHLAVMAAAGIDRADQPLTQRKIAMPSESMLLTLKRETGFESLAALREGGAPIWADWA